MKTARPILYAFIGFVCGALAGAWLAAKVIPDDSGGLSVVIILTAGVIVAFAFGMLGRELSHMQAKSEQTRGNFYMANRVGWTFVITQFVIGFFIPPALSEYTVLSVLVNCVAVLFAAWLSVHYVERKKLWKQDHNPVAIASWITGILGGVAVAVIVASLLSTDLAAAIHWPLTIQGAINLIVTFVALYFFSQQAIKRSGVTAL